MFSRHHRKLRLLFGLSDILLTALSFELAYLTRYWLPLDRLFFLIPPVRALLLGAASLIWLMVGRWLQIHDRLHTAPPRILLRDTLRQCAIGA